MSVSYKIWRQVGAVDEAGEKLISVARECLHVGINQCGPDKPFRGKSACISHLKGQCHEIVHLRVFFHHTTSPGANRHAQKLFRFSSNICGVIRICNQFPGDEFTGESIRIS